MRRAANGLLTRFRPASTACFPQLRWTWSPMNPRPRRPPPRRPRLPRLQTPIPCHPPLLLPPAPLPVTPPRRARPPCQHPPRRPISNLLFPVMPNSPQAYLPPALSSHHSQVRQMFRPRLRNRPHQSPRPPRASNFFLNRLRRATRFGRGVITPRVRWWG